MSRRRAMFTLASALAAVLFAASMLAPPVHAAQNGSAVADDASPKRDTPPSARRGSLADNTFHLPDMSQVVRVLLLRDYNTRIVVIGTVMLGIAAAVVGSFAYLRGRALMGDALSHATLPGVAAAFLIFHDKSLGVLLAGAAATGVLGVLCVLLLRATRRIREDAAIGIVLSVFFGAGMVLMSVVQQSGSGDEAGLSGFIYGRAASMLQRDAQVIGISSAAVILACLMFFKELRLLCFDSAYAATLGYAPTLVDLLLMLMVIITTVVGLQAVGLILIVALLIIPAAAARFWTDSLTRMTLIAGAIGGLSGWLGSTLSALLPRMPTGAVIVLTAGGLFIISFLMAPHRGIIAERIHRRLLNRRVKHQHLLRGLAEWEETHGPIPADRDWLFHQRSWSRAAFRRLLSRSVAKGTIAIDGGLVRLTDSGRAEATRVLRNHRLWEAYLINHAAIAPSHVDRDADEIEHVLPESLVRELEALLRVESYIPASPHAVPIVPIQIAPAQHHAGGAS